MEQVLRVLVEVAYVGLIVPLVNYLWGRYQARGLEHRRLALRKRIADLIQLKGPLSELPPSPAVAKVLTDLDAELQLTIDELAVLKRTPGLTARAAAAAEPPLPPPPRARLAAQFSFWLPLALLPILWIGFSLDEQDEFSATALRENLPLALGVSLFLAVWALCAHYWKRAARWPTTGGAKARIRSALVLFRPTRPVGWIPIVLWHIGLVWVLAVVVLAFTEDLSDPDTVVGLIVVGMMLVSFLGAARGWALAYRAFGDRIAIDPPRVRLVDQVSSVSSEEPPLRG